MSDFVALRHQLDDALREARRVGSGRFDALIHPRVAIVPRRIASLLPLFGGGVCLSIVFIDPRISAAPAPVLRFVVAHEWGHVDRGHIPAAFLALFAGLSRFVVTRSLPTLASSVMELIAWLVIGVALFWKSTMRRELEADAFACTVVGREQAAEGLAWIVGWRGKGWSPAMRKRFDALPAMKQLASVMTVLVISALHGKTIGQKRGYLTLLISIILKILHG